MSQYKLGTVTLDTGSNVVTGDGSQAFLANVAAGNIFTVHGIDVAYEVSHVTSDNQFELSAPWADVDQDNVMYRVTRSFTPEFGIPYVEENDIDTHIIFRRAMFRIEEILSGEDVPIEFASGTLLNPGAFFSEEPGLGFYRPALNEIGIAVNNVQAAKFTVAGIVTALALSAASVTTTAAMTAAGTINANNVTQNIRARADGTNAKDAAFTVTSAGLISIGHWDAAGLPLNISSGNRVLIGTTTDDGVNKLQVSGPLVAVGNITASAAAIISQGSYNTAPSAGAAEANFWVDRVQGSMGADNGPGLFFGHRVDMSNYNDDMYLLYNFPIAVLTGTHSAGTTTLHLTAPLNVQGGTRILLGKVTSGVTTTHEFVNYVSGSGTSTITVTATSFSHASGEEAQVTNPTTQQPLFRLQGGTGLKLNDNTAGGSVGIQFAGYDGVADAWIKRLGISQLLLSATDYLQVNGRSVLAGRTLVGPSATTAIDDSASQLYVYGGASSGQLKVGSSGGHGIIYGGGAGMQIDAPSASWNLSLRTNSVDHIVIKGAGRVLSGVTVPTDDGVTAWQHNGALTATQFNVGTTTENLTSSAGRISMQASGSTVFLVANTGTYTVGLTTVGRLGFGTAGFGSDTAFIERDASDVLAQRRGTTAQNFRVYNTYTDASNYERAFIRYASNVLEWGHEAAGTGTAGRNMSIQFGAGATLIFKESNGTQRWAIDGTRLYPVTDNALDFGASSNTVRAIYAGTSVNVGNAALTLNTVTLGGVGTLARNGGTGELVIATNASGQVTFTPGGASVRPGTNNAKDLGESAQAWRTGYFATSVRTAAIALGTTPDDTKGNVLINTTLAAAGAQQISPMARWEGQGWKTDATAASQAVSFRSYVVPVQGAANPSGYWVMESSINGGSYTELMRASSTGVASITSRVLLGPTLPSDDGTSQLFVYAGGSAGQAKFQNASGGLTLTFGGSGATLNVASSSWNLGFQSNSTDRLKLLGSGRILSGVSLPTDDGVTAWQHAGNMSIAGVSGAIALSVFGVDNVNAGFFRGGATTGQSFGPYVNAGTDSTDYAFLLAKRNGTEILRARGDGAVVFATLVQTPKIALAFGSSTSVSTSATAITSTAQSYGTIAWVYGDTSGLNIFCDLVYMTDATVTVLASHTVSGTPPTRTYTAVGGILKLAMGSGTYGVFARTIV